MTPERWAKIEEIFQAALDLPVAERAPFVRAEAGGDADLIREVEKLIARYETEEAFLESPVWTDSLLLQPSLKQQIADSLEEEMPSIVRREESAIGRQIGAYRLTEEIGKGGMGVVYAAERADGEFRQKVAVKLIKRGMDTDFIVKRFRRERQIAAALSHPNIARLLDGGTTSDGLPYFVMEFIEGKPFFKYAKANNLDLRQKLELFLRVCAAISYAHGKQIIHRDIKPGNILVAADGEPKLLDFGIAKILDPDLLHESVMPTATQMRLMTPEYASPEQARGDEITGASDQYSLGVLLYELLTGARPYKFSSRSPHEIARIICEEIPGEPSNGEFGKMASGDLSLDRDFCQKLDRIVLKSLRKNPAERYASVKEFAADIERFLRGEAVHAESFAGEKDSLEIKQRNVEPSTDSQKSIAVLPFKFFSEVSAENEETTGSKFLGVGLADAMITRLSNVRQFVVRPTSSVLRYGESTADSFAAGEELDVQFVLDGNVIKTDARIRVSVQLLNVRSRSIVWAERFDEKYTDVLELEDRISRRVAELIVPQITTGEMQMLAKRGTENALAYESYLRGRYHWNTFTETSFAQAFAAYNEAIVHDPNYALAYAGIADYYIWLGVYGIAPPTDCYPPAKQAARRAIEIDNRLAEAYAALGFAQLCGDYDWAEAERNVVRAVELNPNYTIARLWYSYVLQTAGRSDEGVRQARRAVELDPLTYTNYHVLAWALYFARRFDEAVAQAAVNVEKFPDIGLAYFTQSWILRFLGEHEAALNASEKAIELSDGSLFVLLGHAQALAADGKKAETEKTLRRIFEQGAAAYLSQYQVALIYAYAGDRERAFAALEAAYADREGWLIWLGAEPALDALRDDRRFAELLNRINHPTEKNISVKPTEQPTLIKDYGARTAESFAASPQMTTVERKAVATRRAGIKQGAFIIVVSLLSLPLLVVLVASIDALSPVHLFAVFLLGFGGGLVRIIYALFFEPKSAFAPGDSPPNLDISFSSRPTVIADGNQTGAERLAQANQTKRRSLKKPTIFGLALISLIVFSYGLYHVVSHSTIDLSSTPPDQRWRGNFASLMNVRRLTTSGKALAAAVSPDGKTVAYVSEENERQSLWVRAVETGEARQIARAENVSYRGLTFSPDGADIYYTAVANAAAGADAIKLYRIRLAGGEPQKVSDQIADNIGFAPDGRRIAYFGFNQKTRVRSLYVAEFDEKQQLQPPVEVASRKFPVYVYGTPAFSPDGQKIAFVSGNGSDQQRTAAISVFDLTTKTEQTLPMRATFYISAIQWRANGEEIVFTANETRNDSSQIWLVAYPSGEVSKLTNDLSNYYGVSLANDSDSLVTTKSETTQNIWTANLTAEASAAAPKQITDGRERQDGLKGLRWTAGDKLLFIAGNAAENILTQTDADGSNSQIINLGDGSMPVSPLVTSDSRFLIYNDEKNDDWAIWRRDQATGATQKITAVNALTPVLTPDDRFVIYSAAGSQDRLTLHRVAIEGGDEIELTSEFSVRPAVSPDGRFIVCYYSGAATGNKWEIAVLNINGGVPLRVIKPPDTVNLQTPFERPLGWSPDGQFIFYLNDKNGISNIFRIAADGSGKPVPMTHFTSGRIFDFSVAPEGRRVVLSRGSTSSDVVIFRNSK